MTKDFDKFHETETVILKAVKPRTVSDLRAYLLSLKFKEIDYFFDLERVDVVCDWQSMDIANVDVFFDDKQLDLIEDDFWNKLTVDYLFASLPFQFVDKFLEVTFSIAEKFNLQIEHNGRTSNIDDLIMAFHEYREDVRQSLDGEPGSEIARINIEMSYPRSR